MRGITLPGRLRRRPAAQVAVSTPAGPRLLPAPVAGQMAAGLASAAADLQAIGDAIEAAGGLFPPGNPYPLNVPAGPAVDRAVRDTGAMDMAARRRGPSLRLRPAPETRPQAALPVNAAVAPDPLARLLADLKKLDPRRIAVAQATGARYADVPPAATPLEQHKVAATLKPEIGDDLARWFFAPASRHPDREWVSRARVDRLAYPPASVVTDDTDYAAVMRRLNQITGTQGWTPRRAITSGGAA